MNDEMEEYGSEMDSIEFLEIAAEAAERLLAVARGYNGYIYQPLKDQPAGLRIGSALMEKVKGAVLKLDVEVKKSLAAAESKAAKEDEPASEA